VGIDPSRYAPAATKPLAKSMTKPSLAGEAANPADGR
jgi:hypothetical protein